MGYSHQQRLEELIADSPTLLKEIVLHDSKYSDRLLFQIKCVEKFKFEESARQSKDIGWQRAWELWAERGYARRFGEVYNDEATFKDLYKEIITFKA
jgi:hypothetical protein